VLTRVSARNRKTVTPGKFADEKELLSPARRNPPGGPEPMPESGTRELPGSAESRFLPT